jgi:hypothetical protein
VAAAEAEAGSAAGGGDAAPPFSLSSIATLSGSMMHDIAGQSAHCSVRMGSGSESSQRRSARRVFIDENITIKQ